MSATLTGQSDRLKERGRPRFEAWVRMPLLAGVARGDLAVEVFRNYLEQDYLYLREYARLYSRLAAAAAEQHIEHLVGLAANIFTVELGTHRSVGTDFGCDFDTVRASPECARYIAFMHEAASSFGEGLVAMLPCLWGYGVALKLVPKESSGPYRRWLDVYSGDEYADMTARHCAMLDEAEVDQARADALFDRALDLEDAFWNQRPPGREC
jgi:thiaminase